MLSLYHSGAEISLQGCEIFSHSRGLTLNKLDTLSLVHYVFGICKWPIYHFTVFGPYNLSHLLMVLLLSTWQSVKH